MDLSSERYCKQFRYTNKFNGHRHVKPTPYILEGPMQFVVTHRSAPPKFHTTIPIRYSADYHHDYNSPTQCAYTTGDCTRLPPHTLTRVPRPLPHSVSRPTITPTALHRTPRHYIGQKDAGGLCVRGADKSPRSNSYRAEPRQGGRWVRLPAGWVHVGSTCGSCSLLLVVAEKICKGNVTPTIDYTHPRQPPVLCCSC